jgi:hypothetical protein
MLCDYAWLLQRQAEQAPAMTHFACLIKRDNFPAGKLQAAPLRPLWVQVKYDWSSWLSTVSSTFSCSVITATAGSSSSSSPGL